jgi:hypothetical protein
LWTAAAQASPSLVVLATDKRAGVTTVLVDGAARARLEHAPDGGVRGAVDERGVIWIAADERRAGESYGAALWRVTDHVERIVGEVAHAARPVPLPGGGVLIVRGSDGPERAGARRVDQLAVDAVTPDGHITRRFETRAWELHVGAAFSDGAALVYEKSDAGSRLLAVPAGNVPRVLSISQSRLRRDFSVDGLGRVVFADGPWVYRLEGERVERLWSSQHPPAPLALSDGRILWNQSGTEVPRASSQGRVAWWRYGTAGEAEVAVVDAQGRTVERMTPPAGWRYEIAGFLP